MNTNTYGTSPSTSYNVPQVASIPAAPSTKPVATGYQTSSYLPESSVPKASGNPTNPIVNDPTKLVMTLLKLTIELMLKHYASSKLEASSPAMPSSYDSKTPPPTSPGASATLPAASSPASASAPTPTPSSNATVPSATAASGAENAPASAPVYAGVGRGADIAATGQVVNVKPGDNIQAAIDGAAEGSTVHFAAGVYQNANINLYKKLTLDGEDGTIFDGGNQTKEAINISKANGAVVQDISFRNYTDKGIYGNSTDGLVLQNLDFSAIGNNQKDRNVSNNDVGIMLDSNTNGVIQNVTMDNIKNKGIGIGASKGMLVQNVQVTNINPEGKYNPNWDATSFKAYDSENTTVRNSVLGNVHGQTDDGRKGGNAIWFDTSGAGNLADGNMIVGQNLSDVYIETTLGARATNNRHEDGNLDLRVSKKSGPGFSEAGNQGVRREEADYVTNKRIP
jgi:hypothetical protein